MAPSPQAPLVGVPQSHPFDNSRGILFMALGFFLFSLVDAAAKLLTEGMHPVQITWTRQVGLLAVAAVFVALRGPRILRSRRPGLQIARGVAAAGSATLFVVAIAYVPLADAVAVSFVAPFVVTVLGAIFLGERVGLRRWAAVTIGFLATLIVVRPGLGVVHPAALLVLVAASFFAIRQVLSRKMAGVDPLETTVVYTALTAWGLLSLPLLFIWRMPQGWEWGLIAIVAVAAGTAELMVIKALDIAEAVVLAPLHYTLMIWGVIWGWLVFGQLPDLWTWVGAAVIVVTGLYTIHRERIAARTGVA